MADSMVARSAVGLCLIAAIAGLMALDHATGHGYGVILVTALVGAAGSREFARLAESSGPIPVRSLVVTSAAYLAVKGLAHELEEPRLHLLEPLLVIAFAYGVLFGCLRGAPSEARFRGVAAAAFGFFYLPFLAGFALDARFLEGVGEAAFLYIVAVSKGSDICAYFAGRLFGKTKIVPSLSPGKTLAGFVGAVAGGAAITSLFVATTSLGRLIPLPLAPGVGIVMALVVISGDLVESFIKRSVEVKDSANLVPTFGGVLDIVDSILMAAPPTYFLLILCEAVR